MNLLNRSSRKEEILEELASSMGVTSPYRVITEKSFLHTQGYGKRSISAGNRYPQEQMLIPARWKILFCSLCIQKKRSGLSEKNMKRMASFLLQKMQYIPWKDLEKLFFIWQEATERQDDAQRIAIGDEIRGEGGLTFSGLTIENAEEEKEKA